MIIVMVIVVVVWENLPVDPSWRRESRRRCLYLRISWWKDDSITKKRVLFKETDIHDLKLKWGKQRLPTRRSNDDDLSFGSFFMLPIVMKNEMLKNLNGRSIDTRIWENLKKVLTKQKRSNRIRGRIDPVELKAVALLQLPQGVHKSLANFAALQIANKGTFQLHIQVLPNPNSIYHCCSHMFLR